MEFRASETESEKVELRRSFFRFDEQPSAKVAERAGPRWRRFMDPGEWARGLLV